MITYDRDDRTMEMECDSCADADLFYGNFEECIAEAKECGWVITKEDGDWTHTCWACVKEENDPRNDFKNA